MTAQTFLVKGKFLGYREVPTYTRFADSAFRITPSWNFFCPDCREIWARVTVDHFASYHNIATRKCFEHGDGTLAEYPSLLEGGGFVYWGEDWPEEAVHHEFKVTLARALKEIENDRVNSEAGARWAENPS